MKVVKHAKYVGTLIGPEGHLHRWNAPRKKFTQRYKKINETSKCLFERLVDFKIYALSVLGYVGFFPCQMKSRLRKNPMPCYVPQLVHTMPCPQIFYERDPYAGSAMIYMENISSVSMSVPEQLPVPEHSPMTLRKSGLHVNPTMLLFKLSRLRGKRGS